MRYLERPLVFCSAKDRFSANWGKYSALRSIWAVEKVSFLLNGDCRGLLPHNVNYAALQAGRSALLYCSPYQPCLKIKVVVELETPLRGVWSRKAFRLPFLCQNSDQRIKLVRNSVSFCGGWTPCALPLSRQRSSHAILRARFRMICIPS